MSALVLLVKLVRFVRSEGGVTVASENAWFESASSEEAEDTFEVVEECVLVAGLDRVAEEVFAAGVSEGDELFVPFDAFGVDGADVVVTYALAYGPLVVFARIGFVGRLGVLGVCGW